MKTFPKKECCLKVLSTYNHGKCDKFLSAWKVNLDLGSQ